MRESRPHPCRPSQRGRQPGQRGAAAFLLLALLGLAMGVLVIGYVRSVQGDSSADGRSVLALAQAREALIGYASTYRDLHPNEAFGYLPCPDRGTGVEGQAQSACGGADVTVIGRLPWKTLDLPPLRDASGECLWYAVSGNFKYNPKTADLMNRDSNGLIEVMAADGAGFVAGASPRQRAVAVIFSPGAIILPGQDRTVATTNPPTVCGGNYSPANYLDTDAASSIANAAASTTANDLSRFIAAERADHTPAADDAFNDLLMPIFPDDIFAHHLDKRADVESALTDPLTGMLRRAADCLVAYGSTSSGGPTQKYLPWAANLNLNVYGDSANYVDAVNMVSGRLPQIVTISALTPASLNPPYATPAQTLLRNAACPAWVDNDKLWENWKDHLFYAVGRAYRPNAAAAGNNVPCNISECINVVDPNGTRPNMAAVVIFSGARQTGQARHNSANPSFGSADKADPANYLEGVNVTSIQSNPLPGAPNRLFSKNAGNDTIMCLDTIAVGLNSVLFVDPTCGTSAQCVTDGALLAAYRSGSTNNCRVGTSGIDATCQTIANRIDINNCPGAGTTYSCERAARDFISYDCLLGFASAACQLAHTTLTTCS